MEDGHLPHVLDSLKHPPLHARVALSTSTNVNHDDAVSTTTVRPLSYKQWDSLNMREAITAVLEKGISVRKAAELHGVPKSTLGDRITGRVLPGKKSGPEPYLNEKEEAELVTFLLRLSSIGYGRTRKDVLVLVEQVLQAKGQTKKVSQGWWEKFIKRHPELTLRTPAMLSSARANAPDRVALDEYFDILEETLERNELTDKPMMIFNMDETGMPLDMKPEKTIHGKGTKNPSFVSSGNKAQITVVGCVNAAGQILPPMVVWNRKTMNPNLAIGEVPGTYYGLSPNGWMDRSLFHKWFENHFLRFAPAGRPLLLLLDGHSSHYCPETIKYAASQKVILFTLPPNTTHLTQPLDKGVYGPLKVAWKNVCHRFLVDNPGLVINRYRFSTLFGEAWLMAMTPKNVMAGFRTTGVYPLSRKAIQIDEKQPTLEEITGISYVPLYTPKKSSLSTAALVSSTPLDEEPPMLQHKTVLSKELEGMPVPPPRVAVKNPKSSTRVLTSDKYIADIEAKDYEEIQKKERSLVRTKNAAKAKQQQFIEKSSTPTGRILGKPM